MRRSRLPFARATAAVVASLALALGLTGCGFDLQSLQPDTHGQGVDADAGEVKIRDLLVIETGEGTGRLGGTLTSSAEDQLVAVSGRVVSLEGTPGREFAGAGSAVTVPAGGVVVLTEGPGVSVSSPELRAGLTVNLTLRFRSGAEATVTTIIVDTENPVYRTVSPAASPTSPQPTP